MVSGHSHIAYGKKNYKYYKKGRDKLIIGTLDCETSSNL